MMKRIKTAFQRLITDVFYAVAIVVWWVFVVIPVSMINDTVKYAKSLWKK
jgi:hypothetical protein